MTTKEHDLVVIGAGPGGYVAAIRAAQFGLNVACVEEVEALGGTCLRIGCIPSKAMLESSERYHEAKAALAPHGVKVSGVDLDLAAMLKRKDEVVGGRTKGVEFLFKKNKVTRYLGHGRIEGPGRVVVKNGSGSAELRTRHIVIATGSKPSTLPGMDMEIAREGQKLLERQGLEFRLGQRVTGARVDGKSCVVECQDAEPIRCDRVLVAVGR